MKKRLLFCLIPVLFLAIQANAVTVVKTFKCEYVSTVTKGGSKNTDYIQLTFDEEKIVKGLYYGNTEELHYIAEVIFKDISQGNLYFYLTGHKFCSGEAVPSKDPDFIAAPHLPEFALEYQYYGYIRNEQLHIDKSWILADSAFDRLVFKLDLSDVTGKWINCMSRCGGLYVRSNYCPEIHIFEDGSGGIDLDNPPSRNFRWKIVDNKIYFTSSGSDRVISLSETNEFRCDLYEEDHFTHLKLIDETTGDWYLLGKEQDN